MENNINNAVYFLQETIKGKDDYDASNILQKFIHPTDNVRSLPVEMSWEFIRKHYEFSPLEDPYFVYKNGKFYTMLHIVYNDSSNNDYVYYVGKNLATLTKEQNIYIQENINQPMKLSDTDAFVLDKPITSVKYNEVQDKLCHAVAKSVCA